MGLTILGVCRPGASREFYFYPVLFILRDVCVCVCAHAYKQTKIYIIILRYIYKNKKDIYIINVIVLYVIMETEN